MKRHAMNWEGFRISKLLIRAGLCALFLVTLVFGPQVPVASAADIAAGVSPGDPTYRELRIAAALGLLDGPLSGTQPLSRAEVFRLLRPLALEMEAGLDPAGDPTRGLTPDLAHRLDRLREEICPWNEFWAKGEYPISFWGWFAKRRSVEFSEITRGRAAPDYLDHGYDHRQGFTAEQDHRFFVEAVGLAFDIHGRMRADGDAVTYRPLTLNLRTGWRNFRAAFGREPMSWGPSVHGNLMLTENARPLDHLRLESESPFALPGPLARMGRFTASMAVGHLDDPDRADASSPWLTGMRVTYAPTKWFLVGGTRTTMLGGGGHEFVITPRSVWNLFTGSNENRDEAQGQNDTNHIAGIDWSLYLWPVLRPLPLLDGGRLYGEYAGEDSPQTGPLPSAPGKTYGIELVSHGVLLRAESSNNRDNANLWYWHKIYTDGYAYRGRVLGHPMGGDSRAQSYDLEVPISDWGLVTLTMERQEHGFRTNPGVPPDQAVDPILNGVQDTFKLAVEKYWGPFPGALRAEVRALREWGDLERLGPLEKWGVTVEWRR